MHCIISSPFWLDACSLLVSNFEVLLLVPPPCPGASGFYVPQDRVYSIIVSWSESSACVALRLSDIGNLTISKSFLISQSLLVNG